MPELGPPIVPGRQPQEPVRPPAPPAPSRGWWATLDPVPKVLLIMFGLAVGLCIAPAGIVAVATSGNPTSGRGTPPVSPTSSRTSPVQAATSATPVRTPATSASPASSPSSSAASSSAAAPPVTVMTTTQPAPVCDPNYSGACVPIASDVDCAGGSGNGPAYVRGPVYVIGTDIYDLDRDGNGVGCED
jgi:hypothetical protein